MSRDSYGAAERWPVFNAGTKTTNIGLPWLALVCCAAVATVLPAQADPQSPQTPTPRAAPLAQEPAKPSEAQKPDEPTLKRAPAFASISGTVYSATTGDPLAGAEVQAIEKGGKDFQTAKTDNTGAYRILGLLSGNYLVACSLSGYATSQFPQESWRVPPFYLAVAVAQQVTNIDFRLQKNSSIAGVVSSEDGRPLAGIQVQALSRYYTHEGLRLEPRGNSRSDSQGRYRITALVPGTYFVQAMKAIGPEGYGAVFFPGADFAGAKPVDLLIGKDLEQINLRLKKSPGYRVAGKLMDLRTDSPVKEAYTVSLTPEIGTAGVLATIAKDGTFQFASLIPGKYRLMASMTDLKTGTPFKVTKHIEVRQADLTDVVMNIGAGATVRVTVSAKESLLPSRLVLALVRREEAEDPGRLVTVLSPSMENTATYVFHNVAEGEYFLILGSTYTMDTDTRRFFLEEVSEATAPESDAAVNPPAKRNAQETGFAVPAGLGTVRLFAVVNTHGGVLHGVAMDGKGQPLLGRAIVLVAADHAQRQLRNCTVIGWTDSSGGFNFTGLVPGEYLAVLWSGSDPGEAQNPALFDELDHNGAHVHIPPDGIIRLALKTGG